jgi:hypothetical protein
MTASKMTASQLLVIATKCVEECASRRLVRAANHCLDSARLHEDRSEWRDVRRQAAKAIAHCVGVQSAAYRDLFGDCEWWNVA